MVKMDLGRFKEIQSKLIPGKTLNLGSVESELHDYLIKNTSDEIIGLDVREEADIQCDLNQGIPLPDNSFDNVVAGEIIEHVHDPIFFSEEMWRILRPGGRLILTTPNMIGIQHLFCNEKKESKRMEMYVPDRSFYPHLHYFLEPALRYVLGRAGFKILQVKRLNNFYRRNLPLRLFGFIFSKYRPVLFVVAEK